MSTKLSLKEALERQGATKESVRERSTSPTVKLVLSFSCIDQPVDVIRLLAGHGLGLKKAHAAVDRLAERRCIAVELVTDNPELIIAELGRLKVSAAVIETPDIDVKSVRRQQGLTQSEFATLYGLDEDTLRNWEQRRYVPDGPAKVLLAVINSRPSAVVQALTADRSGVGGAALPVKTSKIG